jgi:hypothetical protein
VRDHATRDRYACKPGEIGRDFRKFGIEQFFERDAFLLEVERVEREELDLGERRGGDLRADRFRGLGKRYRSLTPSSTWSMRFAMAFWASPILISLYALAY